MNAGTLIVARLGSQRLPRKHLLPLGDARAIDHLIRRVEGAAPVTVLCTTTLASDDELAEAARENGIAVFRGSAENVPARLLLAAREHRLDFVAVVEGDEAFVDRGALETMLAGYTGYDYVAAEGFPIGAHILGMRTSTLETICSATGLEEQNTDGWGRYLTQTGWFQGAELRPSTEQLHRPDYRLTLDYPEDYEVLRAVYDRLYASGKVIPLAEVLALLDQDAALRDLNRQRIGHYATHMKAYPPLKFLGVPRDSSGFLGDGASLNDRPRGTPRNRGTEEPSHYVRTLKIDSAVTLAAQAKFQQSKSEQQKMLEAVLLERYAAEAPLQIGDFACGTGHVSFHLAQIFARAHFTLVDLNDTFVEEAMAVFGGEERAAFLLGDIEKLAPELSGRFDVAICWQTLSWIEGYEKALPELIRALKPGGRLFATFLVNTEHDVDVLSRVVDYTRASSAAGMYGHYNTYSARRLREFVAPLAASIDIHPFRIGIDLEQRPAGLGTYTIRCADGSRLQVSAGMLMNWALVEIRK